MDEIRRRLAEIDRELARSPEHYYKQAISIAPLVFCAIGMMAGIVIQNNLPATVGFWLLLLGICISITAMFYIVRRASLIGEVRTLHILPLITVVCFVCVGAVRLAIFNDAKPNDIRNSVCNESTLATIRGVIVTKPYIDSNDWSFSRFTPTDSGSSFYLEITEVEAVAGWTEASGLVRVRVQEPIMDLQVGDNIQIYCRLDRFDKPSNPGEFDITQYMARKGVFVAASVESRQAIDVGYSNWFMKMKAGLRKIAMVALLGTPHPQDEEEKLLLALVLGYRSDIDRDTIRAFRETGLLHFICLSGMNFAIVIGIVWWTCKTAGLMKPARAVVCIFAAILFLLVVPENAPALRAAVMCFAFCGAFIFRRQSNSFNSLALAAISLLLLRPTELFEADWQLSFISVLGILLFCPRFFPIVREKTIDHPWFTDFMKARPFLPRIAARPEPYSLFSTCFTAWLASAGILVYHFYSINWLTSIWTVLVSPLIGVISFLGYLKLFVAFFLPSVAAIMGVIVTFLSSILIWTVKLLAALGISNILTGKVNGFVIILFYALIIFTFLFRLRNSTLKKTICIISLAVIIVMLAAPRWQRTHNNNLTMTALDVGHGQAMLAELPGGASILFDAGSLSRTDIGTRVVSPFLRYKGIAKIDAVVISHADIDHINGLPEILDDCRVGSVYSNDINNAQNRSTVKFLREELKQKDIKIKPADDPIRNDGPVTVKLLWPDKETYENDKIGANDRSAVTMIEFAGRRILICSDIEKFAQSEILRLYPDLKADILIAPHHGSAKTLDDTFIDKIEPNIVIASCSASSYEKGQVIKPQNSFRSYYTGPDGAVTIRVTKQGNIEANSFIKEK